jgi:hypothetical protein
VVFQEESPYQIAEDYPPDADCDSRLQATSSRREALINKNSSRANVLPLTMDALAELEKSAPDNLVVYFEQPTVEQE